MLKVNEKENWDNTVKHSGISEVPDGKKVWELPMSHFTNLIEKKGYAAIIRALTNLEVWNKNTNKELSQWASDMADKLRHKFRPEYERQEIMDIEQIFNGEKPKDPAHCGKLKMALELSLSEELKAVADYECRAHKAAKHNAPKIAEFFQELANDEKVHVAQIQRALELLGFVDDVAQEKGEAEAEEILDEIIPEPGPIEIDSEILQILEQ